MKTLLISIVFVCFAMVKVFGQKESEVQLRLKSITNTVVVTKEEEKKLIAAILKLISSSQEIRAAKREHMQLEIRENSQRYLTEVLIILDDERYEKWREEVKKKNLESNN